MLTLKDCLAMCELTEDEVLAIAEHEHLPEILAVELGACLVCGPDGVPRIKRIIVEDIEAAQARGDVAHAAKLKLVLEHFCEAHADDLKPVEMHP